MKALTRRRSKDTPEESSRIFYGDVPVGWIGIGAGVPADVDLWGWRCGFYPGMEPRSQRDGSAATYEQARAAFQFAWRHVLPSLTDANFEDWRRHNALGKWKYRMWDAGLKLPTQLAEGRSTCFCGAAIDLENTRQHVYDHHMKRK